MLEHDRVPASQLALLRNGQFARACGIVTVRQRPGTAKGVLFITIEDESGQTNIIVWPAMLERFRREALGASLLAVYGIWQVEGKVKHLVAKWLEDRSNLLDALRVQSHDFSLNKNTKHPTPLNFQSILNYRNNPLTTSWLESSPLLENDSALKIFARVSALAICTEILTSECKRAELPPAK